MNDLESKDVHGLQETHKLVVKALKAERQKVQVLRAELRMSAENIEDVLDALNTADYDDGNHPAITEQMVALRAVILNLDGAALAATEVDA